MKAQKIYNWIGIKREIKSVLKEKTIDSKLENLRIKIVKRIRRIIYPTKKGGWWGELLVTADGFKPSIFTFDQTDGYRWEIRFRRYV